MKRNRLGKIVNLKPNFLLDKLVKTYCEQPINFQFFDVIFLKIFHILLALLKNLITFATDTSKVHAKLTFLNFIFF